MTYMKTFITTYRSFTTPEKLLSKTVQLYHVPEDIEEKKNYQYSYVVLIYLSNG